MSLVFATASLQANSGNPIKSSNSSIMQDNGIEVRGTVKDQNNETMPGVSVYVKESGTGTVTDFDGNYTITVEKGQTIEASFMGYKTYSAIYEGQNPLNIVLIEDASQLDEIVVIGYGTQKKANITGAVAVVDMETLPVKSPTNTAEMLQGSAPGVQVSNSGDPGAGPIIRIRGLNSFGNNNPLFVVDGNPTADTRDLNPRDIASIQVLKDASAAAIYGSRAANGVILVTTKKGKGEMTIDFDARYGVDSAPKSIDMADATEFATIDNMAHDNAGLSHILSSDKVLADPLSMPNTDWQGYIIRPGVIQDYNLSISKGDDKSTYRFALGYFNKEGIVIGSKFERMNMTFSSTHKYNNLNFGINTRIAYSDGSDVIGLPFMDALQALPNVAIYNKYNVGGYGTGDAENATYFTNPVGLQETNINNAQTFKTLTNVFAEYEFTEYLKYKFNFGLDIANQRFLGRREEAYLRYLDGPTSSLTENNNQWVNYTFTNTVTFNKEFGDHSINAVAGLSYEDNWHRGANAYGEEIAKDGAGNYFWVLNAAQKNQRVSGAEEQSILYSEFLRVNYEFADKYLLQLSGRADHSSRFNSDNRTAFFPAASVGWKIHEESFMEDLEDISQLKFRASYGQLGGQELGPYDYQGYINPNVNYVLGADQSMLNGATQIKLANENIKWQTTTTTNVGLDYGFLQNKIIGSVEYYISDTEDAILPVDLAPSTGNYGGNPYQNIGTIRNSGFEFAITYQNMDNEFKYAFTGTIGTLKNEVTDLGTLGQIAGNMTMTRPGYAIGTFFLRETNGIYQEEDAAEAAEFGAHPGDVRYIDQKNIQDADGNWIADGEINDDDRVMMGNPFPTADIGFNARFEYKGFDLSMFFFSQIGHDIYNGSSWWMDRTDDRFNRPAGYTPWTPENKSNTTPIAMMGAEGSRNFYINQDRYLEDGDYLKLKNLEFGYTLPGAFMEKVGFEKLRIYFSGQNLFTLTNYSGWDPEVVNGWILERGVDWGSFPNPRTISFGVQAKF